VPPDSIVDGAIIDGAAVADAIRRVFENKAFKTKEVAASLSGNAVIVKKINLPIMTEAELAESIYWEAEQYIPFDIQDVNLDYQILNSGTGEESAGTMDVLLGRGQEGEDRRLYRRHLPGRPPAGDRRRRRVRAAERLRGQLRAGARRRGRAAQRRRQRDQHQHHHGRSVVFTRDISMGGNSYTEAVQKELNLPFESAEQIKRGHRSRA
jgi:type IV pilus assembly protein PilM